MVITRTLLLYATSLLHCYVVLGNIKHVYLCSYTGLLR